MNFLRLRRTPKLAVPKHETDIFFVDEDGVFKKMGPDGSVAEVGGGGGSLPDQWTVAADGGLKIQPDSDSGHPLDVEAIQSIGGTHIIAESTGKVRLNSQSPTATPATIMLNNGGAIPLTLQADGFIGLGPSSNVGVSEGGYLGIEGLGEVPADSEIGPGGDGAHGAYAVVYFDHTHGAAKLMCKARDIDGTIVTGTICNLS